MALARTHQGRAGPDRLLGGRISTGGRDISSRLCRLVEQYLVSILSF